MNRVRKRGVSVLRWGSGSLVLIGMAVGVHADSKPLSFAPSVSVSLGPSGCEQDVTCSQGPADSTAADFNNDGKLDIATANNLSDDVTILYGDGHGGLTSGLTLTANGGPAGIASGLLNNDQFPDIVISEELANKIGVFLSTGPGTFAPEVEYDMGNSPEGVVLADFNNDTKLDVATADLFGETVSVRLGNGDGTFGDLTQVSVSGGPYELAVGKLDAGDTLDLAVTLNCDSALATLTGNGDGTFLYAGSASAAITDDLPRGVVLADFNHDGKLDAAVAAESFDTVDILLGNGDGTFQTAVPYGVGGFPESVVVGDFNGDNIIDVASADSFGNDAFDSTVSVLIGNGNGTFAASVQFGVDPGAYGLTAADLNNDRLPDLVSDTIDGTTVSVLLNTGTPPTPSCVGDCSGDGTVSINELILGVNIALGSLPVSACPAFDQSGDGMVSINELVGAVNNALSGCPSA